MIEREAGWFYFNHLFFLQSHLFETKERWGGHIQQRAWDELYFASSFLLLLVRLKKKRVSMTCFVV